MPTIKYSLGKVGEILKVSIGVFVDHNNTRFYRGKQINGATIVKTKLKDSDLYNIHMYPFVTIDFTSYEDRVEINNEGIAVSNACKLTLNKYNLFLFLNVVKRMEREFVINKDLYYYTNKKLVLNKEVGEKISVSTEIGDKLVIMKPIVMKVGGGEKEHEGIVLAFNDLAYSVLLTYTELCYLRFVLDKLDVDNMALNMVKLVGENKINTVKNNTVIDLNAPQEPIVQEEEITNDSANNVLHKQENVIPNI